MIARMRQKSWEEYGWMTARIKTADSAGPAAGDLPRTVRQGGGLHRAWNHPILRCSKR